ncbi:MAG: spermine synthase, partial [Candidatus Omnitrophica bacterium]|nr:spermine synthase [Candidatus Omnitrophota bacterium]
MNTILALTILVIGSSGIAAQIILLRELLVSFYGNELTVGVILANWILIEAIGVYWMGRILSRAKNPVNLFFILQFIFSLTLPASVYFARTFKTFSGIPFGEGIGISA